MGHEPNEGRSRTWKKATTKFSPRTFRKTQPSQLIFRLPIFRIITYLFFCKSLGVVISHSGNRMPTRLYREFRQEVFNFHSISRKELSVCVDWKMLLIIRTKKIYVSPEFEVCRLSTNNVNKLDGKWHNYLITSVSTLVSRQRHSGQRDLGEQPPIFIQ